MSSSQTEVDKPLNEITTATEIDKEMRKACAWNPVLKKSRKFRKSRKKCIALEICSIRLEGVQE